jgi:urease beta subunit
MGYHGYILVYSIASRRSLNMLRTINDKLVNLTGDRSTFIRSHYHPSDPSIPPYGGL